MKDKSLLFFLAIFGLFAVFGSILLYRASPETLPERARVALKTAGFRGISVAFAGDRAFLLGEAPSANELSQAAEIVARIKGVTSVDVSNATLKPRLETPHMSLAFVGNQISVRGQVSSEDARDQILSVLKERFSDAEINDGRFVVRGNVEDFGGFAEAPNRIPGVGEKERERGVVAAVGGDAVWQVIKSGEGIEKITAGLAKVLPASEVAETLDEFDDVLTAENLRDDNFDLRRNLAELEEELSGKSKMVRSLELAIGETRKELGEVSDRAQSTEVMLSMTKAMLEKSEGELAGVREELMGKVKELAEANTARTGLEKELRAAATQIEEFQVAITASKERETVALAKVDEMTSEQVKIGEFIERRTSEMEAAKKQHAATKADLESALEEVARLEGALTKAEAKAADLEAKVGRVALTRPTPESVANAGAPSRERVKEIDAVRDAAASAASRAREAAENSVERAKELNKSRGENPSVDPPKTKEADPSGKPIPAAARFGGDKLKSIHEFSAKNVAFPSGGSVPKSDQRGGMAEAMWRELESRDQRILELEIRIELERQADGKVIESLREENAALHEALDLLRERESGDGSSDPGKGDPEKGGWRLR